MSSAPWRLAMNSREMAVATQQKPGTSLQQRSHIMYCGATGDEVGSLFTPEDLLMACPEAAQIAAYWIAKFSWKCLVFLQVFPFWVLLQLLFSIPINLFFWMAELWLSVSYLALLKSSVSFWGLLLYLLLTFLPYISAQSVCVLRYSRIIPGAFQWNDKTFGISVCPKQPHFLHSNLS